MISYTTDSFWKHYGQLEEQVKKRARKAYRLFEQDPSHTTFRKRPLPPAAEFCRYVAGRNCQRSGRLY